MLHSGWLMKQTGWYHREVGWRHILLLLIVFGTLAFILSMPAIVQNPAYHQFSDRREFLGIPNFFDVVSNVPFLLVGVAGVIHCRKSNLMSFPPAWLSFFAGVAVVSFGSGYYHWNPDSDALLWDRLPMTIAFMGLFVALLTEYMAVRLGKVILLPALLLGLTSVLYWHRFDDLRLYFWIQLIPLLTVPVVMVLFRPRYSHQWMLLGALGCYIMAKVAEIYDREIFIFIQQVTGGHSIKHLLAALGCFTLLMMLKKRKEL
jgi:hypothetical protein